jgi:hypothetical protein
MAAGEDSLPSITPCHTSNSATFRDALFWSIHSFTSAEGGPSKFDGGVKYLAARHINAVPDSTPDTKEENIFWFWNYYIFSIIIYFQFLYSKVI